MQPWEYLVVEFGHANNQWHPYKINGRELKNWKKAAPDFEYFNMAGSEGWELVNATNSTSWSQVRSFHAYWAWFKRPKIESGES